MLCFVSNKWKFPRSMLYLIIGELPLIVAVLALTGIAAPNLYRNKLWQQGGDLGFNSKPITIVYSYANYQPVATPLVWSQFTTNFNLIISVLSMFILLTKLTMFILQTWVPVLSIIIHAILAALWGVAIRNQTAPDTIDPNHMNTGMPWYIAKSCDLSSTNQIKGYCLQAKSTFAVSIIAIALYSIHVLLGIHSAIPTRDQVAARRTKIEEKKVFSPDSNTSADEIWQRQWELGEIPPTPGTTGGIKSPFTPRTQAFNTLGGGFPHEREAQDDRPNTAGRGLPLRERFGSYYS